MTAPHAKDALFCFATRGFNFATRKTSLDTLVSALKFYTAPFLPTLAVFCVLLSYQGNYFSLSNYFIFM